MNRQVDENVVRMKAYELWQQRGCPAGNPERDWFAAQQLLGEAPRIPSSNRQNGGLHSLEERSVQEPVLVLRSAPRNALRRLPKRKAR